MPIKTFGKKPTAGGDLIQQVYDLVGRTFPLTLTTDSAGNLLHAEYETTWKEGGTESVTDKDGQITYKENYKKQKLSGTETKKIDGWIADKLKS